MKRKFITNLVLLLSLNLVVKPFWIFGIDRTVQNVVGASEYGLFFALFNFSLLLNMALDFGLTNFNNREISRHSQLLSRYFSRMFIMKLMMAIIYLIVSFSLALAVGYSGRQLWLLGFLVLNQFLASLILYLRSNISGLQLFRTDSFLSVTDRLLMIILCSFMLWGPLRASFNIEWFVYAQTIAYLGTALIAFLIVLGKAEFFKPKFDRAFLISIIKQSYPYALLVLLMSFYSRIDTVMLERLLPDGTVQTGIYAQAFRLLDAATMVPFLFASLLLPIFSRMIKTGDSVHALLGLAFNLVFVISFALTLSCIVYREQIMDVLYLHHPLESSSVLALLMVSFLFISFTYIFGTLLTANGSLRHLNIISILGVVVNVVLNLILIPKYKVVGAAVASLSTQALVAILQLLLVYRTFRIKVLNLRMVSFLAFFIGALLLSFVFNNILTSWILGMVITIISIGILALAVGFIKLKDLALIFKTTDIT